MATAQLRWSWAGIRTCLHAGTYVYSGYRSDINRWFASHATTVCLWHGIPIKRILRDLPGAPADDSRFVRIGRTGEQVPTGCCRRPWMSPGTASCVRSGSRRTAAGRSATRATTISSPRRGRHTQRWSTAGDLRDRIEKADLVVGMFLTWLDDRAFDVADAGLVDRRPSCAPSVAPAGVQGALQRRTGRRRRGAARHLPPEADLNAYLGFCDVLVTDYSSGRPDFLLLDRPTVYYMPDVQRYASKKRLLLRPAPPARDGDARPGLPDEALRELLAAPRPLPADPGADDLRRRVWGDYDGHDVCRRRRAGRDIESRIARETPGVDRLAR